MWTEKYRPEEYKDFVGNPGVVQKFKEWLASFPSGQRCALISGPPGIGKTSLAHLVAKKEGCDLIEYNASDSRSKSDLEPVREALHSYSLFQTSHSRKRIILMDEVDGMGAGDRGGIAELIVLIKDTDVPIVCICNDRYSQKIRTLSNYCLDLRFRRPDIRQLLPYLRFISKQEELNLSDSQLGQIIGETGSDLRQLLNVLYALKYKCKGSRKDEEHSLFDAVLQAFHAKSLKERCEAYFVDDVVPLMVYENCNFNSEAFELLSYSDVIGTRIFKGSDYSLMPIHALYSVGLPSVYGHTGKIEFTQWLGRNSSELKTKRELDALGSKLWVFSNKMNTRSGLEVLVRRAIQRLCKGESAEVAAEMANLGFAKEDFDTAMSIVGAEERYKKVPVKYKGAFTRAFGSEK